MSFIVKDAIASSVALLTRVVDAPTEALGYGRDLSCVTDVTPDLAEVPPDDVLALTQRCARRLLTTRGTLPGDPDYGGNVGAWLNAGVSRAEILSAELAFEGECLKEPGVVGAAVSVTVSGNTFTVDVVITPDNPALGDGRFTLRVSDGVSIVESINA